MPTLPRPRTAPTASPRVRPASMPGRPVLKPALRPLWRGPDTLQLGLDPRHAVVLSGLGPGERQLLALLDGSRDLDSLLTELGEIGTDLGAAERFLDLLLTVGALDEAPPFPAAPAALRRLEPDRLALSLRHPEPGAADRALARRRAAVVAVHGCGRVGASVAALLAAAGVGRLVCRDARPVRPTDLAPAGIVNGSAVSRAAAAVARLRRSGSGVAATTDDELANVAVVASDGAMLAPEIARAVRHLPHLLVTVRENSAAIGPFVLPGQTPCLRCLELTRADRDPQWPTLAAQMVTGLRAVEACDIALATTAASIATMHVLTWIDGDGSELPVSAGGVLDVDVSGSRMRRRSLVRHPACGCIAEE